MCVNMYSISTACMADQILQKKDTLFSLLGKKENPFVIWPYCVNAYCSKDSHVALCIVPNKADMKRVIFLSLSLALLFIKQEKYKEFRKRGVYYNQLMLLL